MKKTLQLALLVCTMFGYAQTQVRHDTTADSSFKAFLPVWEQAHLISSTAIPRFGSSTPRAVTTSRSWVGSAAMAKRVGARSARATIGRRPSTKAAGPR